MTISTPRTAGEAKVANDLAAWINDTSRTFGIKSTDLHPVYAGHALLCALIKSHEQPSAIELELLTALKATEQKMREWSALLDNFAGHPGLAFKAQQVATELRVSAKHLAAIAHAEARTK